MAAVTLLSTRGLARSFGGLRAVDAVDFDLAEGEIRAIIGPNGAGKTTFVGLVCGRVRPSNGRIVFAGRPAGGLLLVDEQGGAVSELTTPRVERGEVRHLHPSWLSRGTHVLLTIATRPVGVPPAP